MRRPRLPLHVPDPLALARRAADEVYFVNALAQRGVLRPQPPLRMARIGLGILTHGAVAGLLVSAGAVLGRYHYAADVFAGWAVAVVVWMVCR